MIKKCKLCSIEFEGHFHSRYCKNCKKESLRLGAERYRKSHREELLEQNKISRNKPENKRRSKERSKLYKQNHKEKVKEDNKIWREKHKDELKEYERLRWIRNREKNHEYQKEYDRTHKELKKKLKRKWYEENFEKQERDRQKYIKKYPERHKANMRASAKIKIPEGKLCEICKIDLARDRHHPDYSKPLEVLLICKACHNRIHKDKGGKGK